MGGSIYGKGNASVCAEYNFHCDPEAAKIVLEAFGDKVHLVPWEACEKAALNW